MPDTSKQTISASQSSALWNINPWLTRWMLWKWFHDDLPIESAGDGRMEWGLKLEPLIIDQAARDLALEVRPNRDSSGQQSYVRRGRLGCSRDAEIIDPTLGPGALETKCVFDYRAWMQDWEGGQSAPRHYETQLQHQMLVGDGEDGEPYRWGVIAVWVAGEVHYLRRDPIEDLWKQLRSETNAFFETIEAGDEPDPFGSAIELPALNAIERTGEVLDLTGDVDLAEEARLFEWAKAETRRFAKQADASKVKLLAALGEASEAECFGGIRLKVSQSKIPEGIRKAYTRSVLSTHVPDNLPDELMDNLQNAEPMA